MIVSPFILILLGIFFLRFLGDIQEARYGSGDMDGLLDNTIRLYLIGIAVSCFGLHPLLGGGSRSYSWECFRFWDTNAMGAGGRKPEHVHNELLQTATDYGAIPGGRIAHRLRGGCNHHCRIPGCVPHIRLSGSV